MCETDIKSNVENRFETMPIFQFPFCVLCVHVSHYFTPLIPRSFGLSLQIEWLLKGSAQQEMVTTYTEKLKQGEEEMGRLHQTMEHLTKKHSSLLLQKESEMLEVRTNYAKQLSQLITDCTSKSRSQVSTRDCTE